jgi:hypothetical protein
MVLDDEVEDHDDEDDDDDDNDDEACGHMNPHFSLNKSPGLYIVRSI